MSGEEVVDGVVEGALKVDPPKSMSAPSSGKGVETACKSAEGYPYDKFFQYLERKHSRSFSGAALVIENTDLNRSLGKESEEEVGSVHSSKGPVTMLSPADIEYSEREGSVIQENFHSESGKSHSSLKHRNVSTQDFKELFDRIDRYVNVLVKIKLSVEAHLQNCKKLCKSASKTASLFVDVWRDTGVRHLDIISKAESAHRQIEFDALDILNQHVQENILELISRQKKEHDVLKDQLKLREDCLKKVLHYDKKLPSLYGSKKHYEEQNKPVPVALEQRIERNLKKQSDAHSKYEKVNWSTYVKLSEFFDQKEQVLQSLYTDWLHAESLFLNSFGDNIREVQSVFTNPTQLGIQALDFPIVSNRRSVDRKPHWYSGIFQPTS